MTFFQNDNLSENSNNIGNTCNMLIRIPFNDQFSCIMIMSCYYYIQYGIITTFCLLVLSVCGIGHMDPGASVGSDSKFCSMDVPLNDSIATIEEFDLSQLSDEDICIICQMHT